MQSCRQKTIRKNSRESFKLWKLIWQNVHFIQKLISEIVDQHQVTMMSMNGRSIGKIWFRKKLKESGNSKIKNHKRSVQDNHLWPNHWAHFGVWYKRMNKFRRRVDFKLLFEALTLILGVFYRQARLKYSSNRFFCCRVKRSYLKKWKLKNNDSYLEVLKKMI